MSTHILEIMLNETDNRAEIMASIDRYKNGYSNKDLNMLLGITDARYFGFGSGPDEKVNSLDELKSQLKRDFAQSENLAIDFGPMAMAWDGNIAWCAGDCTISATVVGELLRLDGRMTAVLRRIGKEWLFAHTHFSVPDREQKTSQSFPEKR